MMLDGWHISAIHIRRGISMISVPFFLCMAPAFVLDSWGTAEVRKRWAHDPTKKPDASKIKLAIEIVSLLTALLGLFVSLAK